ncbi:response regulator [Woeseia oceani]|uniref:Two-component system response regulator BaeR n=1 Tax=Woeseia oceani TaxID=1548547 RepID=A0A193LJY8_9GAMM|nr:response regulator [Woeseia oceani]ANO52714.1 two-component system response regulator BaeR [Woeseia oceani]
MSVATTVLVVEDEPKIAALLRDYLQQANYQVHCLDRGDTVADWVRNHSPDIILLDLMLPGKDGLAVCRELREFTQVPVIMITARIDEIDRLLGLELGADDYVCKPFSPREVIARVKALLRRAQALPTQTVATERLHIDVEKFCATVNGQVVDLTPVEFRLLALLASQPGRVFSRDQLMNNIYDDGRIVSDRTIDSHIKNLRQKVHRAAGSEDIIRSIYGVGYKLE